MLILRIIFLLCFFNLILNAQLEYISATVEVVQIDTIGYYSDITIKDNGKYIAVTGSGSTYPNCTAYSSDYGKSWVKLDYFEKPNFEYYYTKYYSDFKEINFNNDNGVIVFSNYNKYYYYRIDTLERDEYLIKNKNSLEDGTFIDYILNTKINDDYYIFTRNDGGGSYDDGSTITILNRTTFDRRFIKFDMFDLAKRTNAWGEERFKHPYYNDQIITKDKCFIATLTNYIDIGEEYPILSKSLIKIIDFENPKWEIIPLRFTDSTAEHFIYFDDCQNGFLSTYKTYRKEYPRIYKTTDGGINWEKIYEDNELKYVPRNMKRANDSTLFATSGTDYIYRTTNNGYNWSRIKSSSLSKVTDYEIIDENTILVAHDNNTISKFTISTTTDIVQSKENIFISPPYPQPARSDVTIEFDNFSFSIAEFDITIYDISGRKLDYQILDLNSNSFRWDCSSAQPGIYLINIKHGTEEKAVKVVVE